MISAMRARVSAVLLLFLLSASGAAAQGGRAVPGDFDGSGISDLAVTRALGGGLQWYVRHDNGFVGEVPFGLSNDAAVSGDYDGNLNYEPAVVRGIGGFAHWFVLNEADQSAIQVQWGLEGDSFLNGYLDGDSLADIVAVRSINNLLHWFIRGSTGAVFTEIWGVEGNSTFLADLTADGTDELIVAGAEGGFLRWYARTRQDAVPLPAPFFGLADDTALPPYDVDQDGIADFIVVRDTGGFNTFFIRLNNADMSEKAVRQLTLGLSSDQPFVGSFFPGQQASAAVFRNNTPFATFFIDVNGDPAAALPVDFGLQNDSLALPGFASAPPSRLAEVCPVIYSSFPNGVLYKQSSDHSGPPREGKPVALYTRRAPNQLGCVALYATNGEQVTAFGVFERNGRYGSRYYSGFGPLCGFPDYDRGELAEAAAAISRGNPEVYLQWQPGECIGPFDPRQRHGSL